MDPDVVAAVILEPLQGEGGVVCASEGYLAAVRQLCDDRGILMILDEVQSGLARTGEWFGFQHSRIIPDIVTMAKALGNGFPIGACWARDEVAQAFRQGDHASTFGGQPLATAAARETLAVMEEVKAPERAASAGALLRDSLKGLPYVTLVRGEGLLLAMVLERDRAREVTAAALARGLVVNAVTPDAVRLAPPLIVSDAEIAEAIDLLRDSIGEAFS
jgi:acetylornithine/succinyldiaminopimelate/putrescine aminotransferase